jgi:hypothetical protein
MSTINISKGQYISGLEPFKSTGIPTNTMIHKEVTGCGITSFAAKQFEMNAIICLPNRPVIETKVADHNDKCKPNEIILGVHKGIEIEDIEDYLNNDEVTYKKILTTPEGFIDKVVPAFGDEYAKMLTDYFLLLDECERVITDISYRGKIAAPLDLFFDFTNKAMVTATMLPFSDVRFNDFKHLYIEPDYDYSKPITVIETNNVVESLKKRLEELNSDCVLIFLNSTDTILATAKRLGIVDKSNAYCSETSALKLFIKDFKNGSKTLDTKGKGLRKYNFLTSRFFSAFDLTLDFKPDVIMITDVYSARHSILDPQTEVIQIAGRCRNGVNSLTHIANFDQTMNTKTKEEAEHYLQGMFDVYKEFIKLEKRVENQGAKDAIRKAIEESVAHGFYHKGKVNSFMVDNFVNEERVKGYYRDFTYLTEAYALRSKHFVLTTCSELYPLSDADRKRRDSGKSAKEIRKEIAHQIDKVTSTNNRFVIVSLDFQNFVRGLDRKVTAAYDALGLDGLELTDYIYTKMEKAVKEANELKAIRTIAPGVYAKFLPDTSPSETEILDTLTELRKSAGITSRTYASMIKSYFRARRSSSKGVVVWHLFEKLTELVPHRAVTNSGLIN